jgi:hypothetical protein
MKMELTSASPSPSHYCFGSRNSKTATYALSRRSTGGWMVLVASTLMLCSSPALAFAPASGSTISRTVLALAVPSGLDDDISKQLERARKLVEMSKAKLDAKNAVAAAKEAEASTQKSVPFFAAPDSSQDASQKKGKIIKSGSDIDGTLVADGEMMAKLSEEEKWELRSLLEVFKDENGERSEVSASLDKRDVAASIFNLSKSLTLDDYMRIFDKKNRFIGEP